MPIAACKAHTCQVQDRQPLTTASHTLCCTARHQQHSMLQPRHQSVLAPSAAAGTAQVLLSGRRAQLAWRSRRPGRAHRRLQCTAAASLNDGDVWRFQQTPSRELWRHPWFRSEVFASTMAMTLGCMGGAILPLAGSFASTGIITGLVVYTAVAGANVFTSRMLLKQAYVTSSPDYEALGFQIGGPLWRRVTELSLFVLLFGSMVGQMMQVGEVAAASLRLFGGPVLPQKVLMAGLVALLVMPWCFVQEMKQLQATAVVGYPIVLLLTLSIVARCIQQGFPAITAGSVAVLSMPTPAMLAGAVSTASFAYYIQPLMMPMLSETQPGRLGAKIVEGGVSSVLYGTAYLPYVVAGVFGASLWGPAATRTGNCLQNSIFGSSPAAMQSQAALNLLMAAYLCLSIPPISYSAAHVLESWLDSLARQFSCLKRTLTARPGQEHVLRAVTNCTCVLASLLVALAMRGSSASLVTLTGATGVFMVSYFIPVVNHFVLLTRRAHCQDKRRNRKADLKLITSRLRTWPYSMLSIEAGSMADSPMLGDALQQDARTVLRTQDPLAVTDPQRYRAPGRIVQKNGREMVVLSDVVLPLLVCAFGAIASACSLGAVAQGVAGVAKTAAVGG